MSSNELLRLVALWGPPRSGTTWLGQIFDSHPAVAYRYQPLFSYRFKSAVSNTSSSEAVRHFLAELSATDDDFVLQSSKRSEGLVPHFAKTIPSHLVFKEVRYLHLAEHFLGAIDNSIAVGIIRHPCATINSWLKTPREFDPTWNWRDEWRSGNRKNQGRPEEYYGFDRWKWTANYFLKLATHYKDRFILLNYRDLVASPTQKISRLFARCGLDERLQVDAFIHSSQATEIEHPDSVCRKPEVADRWRSELQPEIREAILAECRGTALEQFCS